MPEHKKATLKAMLAEEVAWARTCKPCLRFVKIADGAKDNWTYLDEDLPEGPSIVDFYHAAEHLKAALDAAYGETSPKARGADLSSILIRAPDASSNSTTHSAPLALLAGTSSTKPGWDSDRDGPSAASPSTCLLSTT